MILTTLKHRIYLLENKVLLKLENEILENYLSRIRISKTEKKYEKVRWVGSDFFYLPKSYFKSFRFIGQLVRKFNIFLEFAVGLILYGIEDEKSIIMTNVSYDWGHVFNIKDIDQYGDLIHPVKLSHYIYSKQKGFNFCEFFLKKKYNLTYEPPHE